MCCRLLPCHVVSVMREEEEEDEEEGALSVRRPFPLLSVSSFLCRTKVSLLLKCDFFSSALSAAATRS